MNEDKKSISPVSSDMAELSEQQADESTKPHEAQEVSEESSAPTEEVKGEIQQPQTKDQEAQHIETPEKSYWLKEKLSIVFGFGALSLCLNLVVVSFLSAIIAGDLYNNGYELVAQIIMKIFQIMYLAIPIVATVIPIIGIFLGYKYEKATKKRSVGKIVSIVGVIVAIILVSAVIFIYIQHEAKEAEEERKIQECYDLIQPKDNDNEPLGGAVPTVFCGPYN